jgi:hypothetical protein
MLQRSIALILLAFAISSCTTPSSTDEDRPRSPRPPDDPTGRSPGVLATAPESFLQACRDTADAVGYPVPCPALILAGGSPPPPATSSCHIELIGAAGLGGCHRAWRGWVVGSMQTSQDHLVLQAAPRTVSSLARAVDGPGWYPGASVRTIRSLRLRDWTVREIAVPLATNEGSAFARHLVLVWTARDHTYAIGFHRAGSLHRTRALNAMVVRSVRLIPPRPTAQARSVARPPSFWVYA